jgi:polar amino acid transport system substrate-binding protein
MQMAAGVYDAIAVDIGVAQFQLAANEGKYRILDEPLSKEQYAIAFKKGNTELLDKLNAGLAELKENGTYDELVAKWFN